MYLVIWMTSKIAKVQTQGRTCSQSFIIISSDSKKEYQELINKEKISLAEEAMKHLPQRRVRSSTLHLRWTCTLQKVLHFYVQRLTSQDAKLSLQYIDIVVDECFRFRIKVVDHHNPANVPNGMSHADSQDLYCSECDQDFGVMGRWWKDHGGAPYHQLLQFLIQD